MNTKRSHVSRTKRGESRAYFLIEWLNGTKGSLANKRVVDLIETFRELAEAQSAEFPRARLVPQSKLRATAAQLANVRKFMVVRRKLKSQLKRYWFQPEQEWTSRGSWIVSWRHSNKAGGIYITVSQQGDDVPVNEGDAVLNLFRLGEQGYFDRIQECQLCGKWLFARFKHQAYCSTKCQQQAYKSSEAWKQHRRDWMRGYRKLKSSGKVR